MYVSDKPRSLSKVVFFFKPGGSLKINLILVSATPGAEDMQFTVKVFCQKALITMHLK